eukprot:Clim_evm18s5 gene=Clim_evmTU18s5
MYGNVNPKRPVTGDLENAVYSLKKTLRTVPEDKHGLSLVNEAVVAGLKTGEAYAVLPLLHFGLIGQNPDLPNEWSNLGYGDIRSVSDQKFVERTWSLLRRHFDYAPMLSQEQFFAKGFAERKMQLLEDVIVLTHEHMRQIKRRSNRPAQTPKSATGSGNRAPHGTAREMPRSILKKPSTSAAMHLEWSCGNASAKVNPGKYPPTQGRYVEAESDLATRMGPPRAMTVEQRRRWFDGHMEKIMDRLEAMELRVADVSNSPGQTGIAAPAAGGLAPRTRLTNATDHSSTYDRPTDFFNVSPPDIDVHNPHTHDQVGHNTAGSLATDDFVQIPDNLDETERPDMLTEYSVTGGNTDPSLFDGSEYASRVGGTEAFEDKEFALFQEHIQLQIMAAQDHFKKTAFSDNESPVVNVVTVQDKPRAIPP